MKPSQILGGDGPLVVLVQIFLGPGADDAEALRVAAERAVARHQDRKPAVVVEVARVVGVAVDLGERHIRERRHREGELVEVDLGVRLAVREFDRMVTAVAALTVIVPARERQQPFRRLRDRQIVHPAVAAVRHPRWRKNDDAVGGLDVDAGGDLAAPALDVEAVGWPFEEEVAAARR